MNRTYGRRLFDRLSTALFCLVALALVAVIGAVALYLIKKGAGTLSIEFLTQPPRDGMMAGGILTPLIGTMQARPRLDGRRSAGRRDNGALLRRVREGYVVRPAHEEHAI